jgi:hypothetical protein
MVAATAVVIAAPSQDETVRRGAAARDLSFIELRFSVRDVGSRAVRGTRELAVVASTVCRRKRIK